jgi:prepilin-type N-terminal cleavage/methylation domain-containing protein
MDLSQRSRDRGFTLIELLVVVAIIGIVAVILIPNLLDAVQKAKQKRTMATLRDVGTAWLSWMTDEVSSAAAGAGGAGLFSYESLEVISAENLGALLVPEDGVRYASDVPKRDSWANPLEYAWSEDMKSASTGLAIRSFGRDGEEGPTAPPYPMGPFQVTEYAEDIVWSDGFFVRYPAGAKMQ